MPYVAVPDEAMRRRRELSHGAWDLYERYCSHRNRDTGRCDPSLSCLVEEMERTYCHVADMKTELVKKGWIRRTGRHAVELLVGSFAPPKVRAIEKTACLVRKVPNEGDASFGKNPNEGDASFGTFRTFVRKVPNEASSSPYTDELLKEQQKEAAAPAAASPSAWKHEKVDEEYLAEVKREGIYPPPFVEFVWRKLKSRCRKEKVEPNKGRLDYWLGKEWAQPVQPQLFADTVTQTDFQEGSQPRPTPAALRAPSPDCAVCCGTGEIEGQVCACRHCPLCFNTGMEVVKGKGARPCKCRQIQEPASEAGRASDDGESEREAQLG